MVGGLMVAMALPASAATIDTGATYVFVNRFSGKAMDVYGWSTSNGAPVNQWSRNDLAVQQWKFQSSGTSGYYEIKNVHSGKLLELAGSTDGTQLTQNSDGNTKTQHWAVKDSDSGYVRFINRASGKAIDVWEWKTEDGAKLAGFSDLNGANQQWSLTKLGSGGDPGTGAPTGQWPSSAGSVKISGTVSVSGTFDGGMKTYCCIGDGGQSESQDPMFKIANGGTLQNVIIGSPAGDGVHCEGTCTLKNVWWNDIGEDAATFKGTGGGTSYVIGGGARSGSDKTFQHNGNGTVSISGFYLNGSGKLYRACGNCSSSHQRHVKIDNVLVSDVDMVAGINSNWGDTATITRLVVDGGATVCGKYKGVSKGSEPSYIGEGWNDSNCKVTKSDVTYK
ncbi:pectate lyase [Planomonospora venezuelensis]|uniref:Pectate lyase n=1 Tax=Planomonospora venezuelensis TaxID=1999 RepID=A0A841DHG5_PLAVE|nr:pectate lyase [Planomonospora venezuelensis]MBB5968153.1 hypothetical protein [Planomonospora venezuelensis]GIM65201.1 hypothetical protein Pve01_85360 [Planomonospora venezuelensis]